MLLTKEIASIASFFRSRVGMNCPALITQTSFPAARISIVTDRDRSHCLFGRFEKFVQRLLLGVLIWLEKDALVHVLPFEE
jgi:hypothetical protein